MFSFSIVLVFHLINAKHCQLIQCFSSTSRVLLYIAQQYFLYYTVTLEITKISTNKVGKMLFLKTFYHPPSPLTSRYLRSIASYLQGSSISDKMSAEILLENALFHFGNCHLLWRKGFSKYDSAYKTIFTI